MVSQDMTANWRPLAAAYGEGTGCPAREAAVMVAALLADLTRFHRSGAHGAIDPDHVLVADGGRARVAPASGATAAPAFQAPEQHTGQPASVAGDVFSAGVVFYRLLTGVNPFDGTPAMIRQRVTSMMPPRPSDIVPGVPRAFDAVVEKALAKRPEERYASASAFAEAVMQALLPGSTGSLAGDMEATQAGGKAGLETTLVRRPAATADATVVRGPAADATVMRKPAADPGATVARPGEDSTLRMNRAAAQAAVIAAEAALTPAAPAGKQRGKHGALIAGAMMAAGMGVLAIMFLTS